MLRRWLRSLRIVSPRQAAAFAHRDRVLATSELGHLQRAVAESTRLQSRVFAHMHHGVAVASYLSAPDWRGRVARSRLRVSEFKHLGVVVGRHRGMPFAQRAPCLMCGGHCVETVAHFLLLCPHWQVQRDELWRAVQDLMPGSVWAPLRDALAAPAAPPNSSLLLCLLLGGSTPPHIRPLFGAGHRRLRAEFDKAATRFLVANLPSTYACTAAAMCPHDVPATATYV